MTMFDWQGSYCGPPPDAATWAARWNADPALLALLAAGAAVAVARLDGVRRMAALAAVAVLALAFASPLCALTTALFAARSVHHLLVAAVAAPLLAVAWPTRRAPGMIVSLVAATAVLWAWHLPSLYAAALSDPALYWAMQAALLAASWAYWNALRHARAVDGVAGIVGGAVQMGFLGALLTFATRPLYEPHFASTVAFGMGPLADQQLGGLVMWLPGMAPYAIAGAWLAARRWRALAAA